MTLCTLEKDMKTMHIITYASGKPLSGLDCMVTSYASGAPPSSKLARQVTQVTAISLCYCSNREGRPCGNICSPIGDKTVVC